MTLLLNFFCTASLSAGYAAGSSSQSGTDAFVGTTKA